MGFKVTFWHEFDLEATERIVTRMNDLCYKCAILRHLVNMLSILGLRASRCGPRLTLRFLALAATFRVSPNSFILIGFYKCLQ